jgi:hypothetical protein
VSCNYVLDTSTGGLSIYSPNRFQDRDISVPTANMAMS